MAINKMAPEIAGEVLRELGHGTEADQLLIKIRAAKPEEVRELIDNLNGRANQAIADDRLQEMLDASIARLASGRSDFATETERLNNI